MKKRSTSHITRKYISRLKKVNNKSKISIIISAFAADLYIKECLFSIDNQTYFEYFNDYEILVGIDGCPSTLAEVSKFKDTIRNLKVIWFPVNSGPYLVFNTLVSLSKFQTISIFGADDIMEENFIEHNLSLLKNKSCVFAMGCNFTHPHKEEKQKKYNPEGVILFNKSNFVSINGFEPWRCGADSDLKNRFKILGLTLINANTATYLRRLHKDSLTASDNIYGFGGEYRKKIQKIVKARKTAKIEKYCILSNYQII